MVERQQTDTLFSARLAVSIPCRRRTGRLPESLHQIPLRHRAARSIATDQAKDQRQSSLTSPRGRRPTPGHPRTRQARRHPLREALRGPDIAVGTAPSSRRFIRRQSTRCGPACPADWPGGRVRATGVQVPRRWRRASTRSATSRSTSVEAAGPGQPVDHPAVPVEPHGHVRHGRLDLRGELGEPAPDQHRHSTAVHGYQVRDAEAVPGRAHHTKLVHLDLAAAQRCPPVQRPCPKVNPVADAP
jgi:hypothetical protein